MNGTLKMLYACLYQVKIQLHFRTLKLFCYSYVYVMYSYVYFELVSGNNEYGHI